MSKEILYIFLLFFGYLRHITTNFFLLSICVFKKLFFPKDIIREKRRVLYIFECLRYSRKDWKKYLNSNFNDLFGSSEKLNK